MKLATNLTVLANKNSTLDFYIALISLFNLVKIKYGFSLSNKILLLQKEEYTFKL